MRFDHITQSRDQFFHYSHYNYQYLVNISFESTFLKLKL